MIRVHVFTIIFVYYITWTLYHQQVIETYNLLLWMIDLKNLPDDYEPPSMYNMLVQTRFTHSYVTGSSLIKRLYTFMCTHIQDKYTFSFFKNTCHFMYMYICKTCTRQWKKKNSISKIDRTKQKKPQHISIFRVYLYIFIRLTLNYLKMKIIWKSKKWKQKYM